MMKDAGHPPHRANRGVIRVHRQANPGFFGSLADRPGEVQEAFPHLFLADNTNLVERFGFPDTIEVKRPETSFPSAGSLEVTDPFVPVEVRPEPPFHHRNTCFGNNPDCATDVFDLLISSFLTKS